jgi:signal transduction histidine kinase
MTLNSYALSLLIAAVISLSLAIFVWTRRGVAGAKLFVLLMATLTIWSLGYGFELASSDLSAMRRWVIFEYVGIAFAPVLWLLFTLHYSGWADRLRRWHYGALMIIPALTLLLNASNERLHWLYYQEVGLDLNGPFPLLAISPGPWYWVHVGYSYLCMLAGALVLTRLWLHTPGLYRRQVTLVLIAACLPLGLNVAYIAGIRPFERIDLAPFAFTATGMLVTLGIFRFSLFDLTPIARNSLFEGLSDPVLVLDAQGRLADLNQAARTALGPGFQPVLGQSAAESLTPWPALAALCVGSDDSRAELDLATQPPATYEATRSPLRDQRGRRLGQILVLRDITQRRRAELERLDMERQVLYTQKLESLGLLAGGIAHDFNNLLMSILGNLDLARLDMAADHPAQEALGDAERASRRAADLTRQLLAYAGKGAFVIRAVNLSGMVEEMAAILRVSVGRHIRFLLSLDSDLPHFQGDTSQIQQIILNLITNASEAIGAHHGTITLSTGMRRAEADELARSRLEQKPDPGLFVYLSVTDSGMGMDATTLERLFEPFFTTKDYGRGLGMATVLGVVRSHGGAVIVESAPGSGATITVLFPVTDSTQPETAEVGGR